MTAILQPLIPAPQRQAAGRALPGMQAVAGQDWITVDPAYADQLAAKAALLASPRRDSVLASLPGTQPTLGELLDEILHLLTARDDFDVGADTVRRPDGVTVALRDDDPLVTVSGLLQEDICLLEKRGDEHILTAALLCFPASWTLAEKIGRPLSAIHTPVAEYDTGIAARVQRLFDGVKAGRPMWRANLMQYTDADPYHPRSETNRRPHDPTTARFDRSERQTVWRLPQSGAVVFSIHTTITPIEPESGRPDQTITS